MESSLEPSPEDAVPHRQQQQTPIDNLCVPKPKRLACMICRKRKLKCDGVRPSCSTCSRLGHSCAYDEQRRKSGPKRGYVKALEERLKQVETLLKTQEPTPNGPVATGTATTLPTVPSGTSNITINGAEWDMDHQGLNDETSAQPTPLDDFQFSSHLAMGVDDVGGGNFSWEMIGLGLEEPLPPQETIDELHQIYFEKVHPSMPMIHRDRYLAAMNLAPGKRPPVCLRYAMWTMASSVADHYTDMRDLFYQRARKYVEGDYVKGYGERIISVAHCQTHILLSCFEMKMMYFPRAWISIGSAVRLAQMIGLYRLDGDGLDVKQCLPCPKDWTEREERRRTFWMAFCEDRYASIGTGWPMIIDERDILTHLPASEEAFEMNKPEQAPSLQEAVNPSGAAKLSSFGSVVFVSYLFGRNLLHLHRPDDDDQESDLNGPFWRRHRQLDNIILNTLLSMPDRLKLPRGLANQNAVFANMSIHTSTICLHQAAIFKADKNKLPASVGGESKVRCITAANEIASIMKTISHMDLASMNSFLSFCLYVSARVFIQYLKSRADDDQAFTSLKFLLSAMAAIKRRNRITESFLAQLDVELETLVRHDPRLRAAFPPPEDSPEPHNNKKNDKTGPRPCDGEINGIMRYRDEYTFAATTGDGGNQTRGLGIVQPPKNTSTPAVDTSISIGLDSNNWLRTIGQTGDGCGRMNESPDSASGVGNVNSSLLATMGDTTSGQGLYTPSSISPLTQNISHTGNMQHRQQQFFNTQGVAFGMSEHQSVAFEMPDEWPGIGETSLDTLLDMMPADAMEALDRELNGLNGDQMDLAK